MSERRFPWALLLPPLLTLMVCAAPVPRPRAPRHPQPVVQQTERYDCGPAVLTMLLQSSGKSYHLAAAKRRMPYREGGATLQALIDAAGAEGLPLRGLRLNLMALQSGPLPAVALVRPDHYVIVDGFTAGGDVLVRDPARGRQSLSPDRFQAIWSGIALVPEQTAATPRN